MGAVAIVTDEERAVAVALADAWNAYLKLPIEHPNEQPEFCAAIHACQNIVLSRAGRRAINGSLD